MPYLGKDWRSNGEKWIRTDQGWERCKALESILNGLNIEYRSDAVRKADNKKYRNDALFYLFDELDELDQNEPEPGDAAELSNPSFAKKQPCICIHEKKSTDRKNNAPKLSVSEVLHGLDMPGAVRDLKRFNYVYQLMKIMIEEKLNLLSGNGQRTLFMIIKVMIIQALRSKENTNLVRKLLATLKKKIQESIFFYFHYIGSQKLCDSHLNKISKWQELLDTETKKDKLRHLKENIGANYLEVMPRDCKLEILRRLNSGLDIVNMSMANKSLNQAISNEILVWKNLCQFHFNQSQINQHVIRLKKQNGENENTSQHTEGIDSLDWKLIYFKLTKRFGRKEVYADMVNKCMSCKCLFWKEMGHPCRYGFGSSSQDSLLYETSYEPVTPRKLIDLLFI
ncbi:F-box only 25 isoform X2 [Brachionus plicatilis]|uniref:F-box only 25 isoform X2 n=1 Tax=Brachionus plicatilis TaxID=10195 RepID=A0A3M7SEZ0_BRAPC|nr:F-box only 25 isoform X2 [Brachionus plicatilis]